MNDEYTFCKIITLAIASFTTYIAIILNNFPLFGLIFILYIVCDTIINYLFNNFDDFD